MASPWTLCLLTNTESQSCAHLCIFGELYIHSFGATYLTSELPLLIIPSRTVRFYVKGLPCNGNFKMQHSVVLLATLATEEPFPDSQVWS